MFEIEFRIVVSLSFVVAMVSLTVTRSRLFRGFRDWVDSASAKDVNADPTLWYELVKCPFCFGFWATGLTIPVLFPLWASIAHGFSEWIAHYATVWGLACVICGMITKLFENGGTLRND